MFIQSRYQVLRFFLEIKRVNEPDNGRTDTIIPTRISDKRTTGELWATFCLRVNRKSTLRATVTTMAAKIYEFDVAMTCEGCSGAVERVLGKKTGIENIEIDLPAKKVFVTTSLPSDEVLSYIQKTGKAASFVGVKG